MGSLAFAKVCSRTVQIPALILATVTAFLLINPVQYDFAGISNYAPGARQLRNANESEYEASGETGPEIDEVSAAVSADDIIDYSRCSPQKPLQIFVHEFDHPVAKALQQHPTVTKDEKDACLFFAFTDGEPSSLPSTWTLASNPGNNHIVVNVNSDVSIAPRGNEMIVQSQFADNKFRPLIDLSLFLDLLPFDIATWMKRPLIMPPHRENDFLLVSDTDESAPNNVVKVECKGDCSSYLNTSTFCFLPPSPTFQSRLLSSLRGGCIPIVLSSTLPLPFQDLLEWSLASFRYPLSMLPSLPEILEDLEKEEVIEMRRRMRVFLARIDDAEALATSLVAALSDRIHLNLPLYPEVPANVIHNLAPNGKFGNKTYDFVRKPSKSQTLSAARLYSRARWNTGRLLSYSPRTVYDVPFLPGDAGIHNGVRENFRTLNGGQRLGLTRDEEQFTVIVLTYDRDVGVKKVIDKLKDCPHLNKIIIVWNHQERKPNFTWPEIHVPVEFVQSTKNSLNSRFLPYDNIETEGVFSMDDDCHITQPEIVYGFKMWRENRDRVVGFPDRTHKFSGGVCKYGMYVTCEHSMVLTGLTFFHKEFLFEYSYNQHPVILEHIASNRNCEDIAMNFLVSHITRKPPIKVIKKTGLTPWGSKPGLSARSSHSKNRGLCLQMFTDLYGYNPLLYSQAVTSPHTRCRNGL